MRKILAPILFFIILLLGSLLLPKIAHAACQGATVSQETFDPNFKGEVTITTTDHCFNQIDYTVAAYNNSITKPESKTSYSNGLYTTTQNAFSQSNVRTADDKAIKFTLDLTMPSFTIGGGIGDTKKGSIGKDHPGTWTLKVCQSSKFCTENSLVSISVTVSSTAPVPAPTDVPKVRIFGKQCVYQTGSEVVLTLDKLKPNTPYRWWWLGEKTVKPGQTKALSDVNPTAPFTIPSDETQELGIRTFCLDIERSMVGPDRAGRCNLGFPNSVTLKFVAAPPEGDTTCVNATTGQQNPDLSDGPPPPCGDEIKNPKGEVIKCAAVETALGSIKTDPAGFIRSIFSLLLGVSGGIAVILIIVSGYRLMASQGNPEQVQGAREMLTSAIVGLLFIIFSFVILQVIGVDILKIPGFSS